MRCGTSKLIKCDQVVTHQDRKYKRNVTILFCNCIFLSQQMIKPRRCTFMFGRCVWYLLHISAFSAICRDTIWNYKRLYLNTAEKVEIFGTFDGAWPAFFLVVVLLYVFFCSMYCLFWDVPRIVLCICVMNNCHRVATQLQLNKKK